MRVGTNSAFAMAGFAIPALTLIVSYPVILRSIGADAFGVYTLAFSLGGSVALFDFGVAVATIHFVAEDHAHRDATSLGVTLSTSLCFYGLLAVTSGALIALATPILLSLFKIPLGLQPVAKTAFRLGAVQLGAGLLLNVLTAFFKGMGRFDVSSFATSLLSLLTYGGAAVATRLAGGGLQAVSVISAGASVVVLCGSGFMAYRLLRSEGIGLASPSASAFRRLWRYGVVMTLNSVAGIGVNQLPRIFIGARLGPQAVTIYTLAFTVASKVHAVVAATSEVLFPFTSSAREASTVRRVYIRMLGGSVLLAGATMVPLVLVPRWILTMWVGGALANETAGLLAVFAVAFFVLALSPAPYHLSNGLGRPGWNSIYVIVHFVVFLAATALLGVFSGAWLRSLAWGLLAANVVSVGGFLIFIERVFKTGLVRRRAWHETGEALS